MAHKDAEAIWKELWKQKREGIEHPFICDIGKKLGLSDSRISRIAEKWASKGLINYGVSAWTGWIEEGITEEDLENDRINSHVFACYGKHCYIQDCKGDYHKREDLK